MHTICNYTNTCININANFYFQGVQGNIQIDLGRAWWGLFDNWCKPCRTSPQCSQQSPQVEVCKIPYENSKNAILSAFCSQGYYDTDISWYMFLSWWMKVMNPQNFLHISDLHKCRLQPLIHHPWQVAWCPVSWSLGRSDQWCRAIQVAQRDYAAVKALHSWEWDPNRWPTEDLTSISSAAHGFRKW